MVSRVSEAPPASPVPFPHDPPGGPAPLPECVREGGARRDLPLPPGPVECEDGREPTPCGSAPGDAPPPRRIRRPWELGHCRLRDSGLATGTGGGGCGGRGAAGPLSAKVAQFRHYFEATGESLRRDRRNRCRW